jgi:hypothetical protein
MRASVRIGHLDREGTRDMIGLIMLSISPRTAFEKLMESKLCFTVHGICGSDMPNLDRVRFPYGHNVTWLAYLVPKLTLNPRQAAGVDSCLTKGSEEDLLPLPYHWPKRLPGI